MYALQIHLFCCIRCSDATQAWDEAVVSPIQTLQTIFENSCLVLFVCNEQHRSGIIISPDRDLGSRNICEILTENFADIDRYSRQSGKDSHLGYV